MITSSFFCFVFVFLRRVKNFSILIYTKLNLIYTQAPLVDSWTAVENDYYYQLTVNCLSTSHQSTNTFGQQSTNMQHTIK